MGTDIAAGNAMDAADTAMNVVVDAVTAGVTDMKQAMQQRHTVRKFTSEPLSPLHSLYPHIGQEAYIFIFCSPHFFQCGKISRLYVLDSLQYLGRRKIPPF